MVPSGVIAQKLGGLKVATVKGAYTPETGAGLTSAFRLVYHLRFAGNLCTEQHAILGKGCDFQRHERSRRATAVASATLASPESLLTVSRALS